MNLAERVSLRMQQLGIKSAAELGRRLGNKSNSTVSSLLTGRSKTYRDIPKLAEALETSAEWLTTGSGPVESNPKSGRPYVEPDPKYLRILGLCLREWKKPAYKNLDEKTVIEIAGTIYEQTKTSGSNKQLISQAVTLMAHQAKHGSARRG